MDAHAIRDAAEQHGHAVLTGDIEHIRADLIPELHVHIPNIATAVPDQLQSICVESVETFGDYAESVIVYRGPNDSLRMRSRWEDRGAGRPQIVSSAPA
ncbi:MAG: hypothetical protein ACYDHH_14910 [Solirubrobacteraceae bacterium]